MPPGVEFCIPVLVETKEVVILSVICIIESLVHEVVKFITAVEVTASFTWAGRNIINCALMMEFIPVGNLSSTVCKTTCFRSGVGFTGLVIATDVNTIFSIKDKVVVTGIAT